MDGLIPQPIPDRFLEPFHVEHLAVPTLPNPRHERIAQARAEGMTADEAYVAAGYKKHRGNASRLSTNESILARVAEIVAAAAAQVEMTLAEALQFCADVIRTPVGDIDECSPLAQEVTYEVKGGKKIKLPSKLDALEKLAKFKGWFAPEKLSVDASDPLLAVLARARQRK